MHDELVAGEARHQVAGARRDLQAVGDEHQQHVADMVPMHVFTC